LLICVYLVTDTRFRSGEKARSLVSDETDQKSTRRLVLAVVVSILFLLLAPLFNCFRFGRLGAGWFPGWFGVGIMVLGIALRAWSTRVLGRFYTRTLLITPDHGVVQEGSYRLVRHPGYSGSLLVWIGAGLAALNWIVFLMVTLVCLIAYIYRIQSEEAMLVARFGKEYEDYIQRTKRLIPYFY
jgi:protein-S-isoprenylcysteine O-methyltransferase